MDKLTLKSALLKAALELLQPFNAVNPKVIGNSGAAILYFTDSDEIDNVLPNIAVGDLVAGAGVVAGSLVSAKDNAEGTVTIDNNLSAAAGLVVTLGGAVTAGDTSKAVTALPAAVKKGTVLVFQANGATSLGSLVVSEDAALGATTLNFYAAALNIDSGATAPLGYTQAISIQPVIGTGDGSTKAFAGTIALQSGQAIHKGSVVITDGTETFTDDGNGVLVSDQAAGTNGTINYLTGAVSVSFVANVANNQEVYASSLKYGSAVNYKFDPKVTHLDPPSEVAKVAYQEGGKNAISLKIHVQNFKNFEQE